MVSYLIMVSYIPGNSLFIIMENDDCDDDHVYDNKSDMLLIIAIMIMIG